jgi:7-cyano-7-deazaguanine synthase
MKKVVIAVSGGMDSVLLMHMAAAQGYDCIHTVTFNYGQRHSREIQCIRLQLDEINRLYPGIKWVTNDILDVTYLKHLAPTSSLTNDEIDNPHIKDMAGEAQPSSYVPFRNLQFLSIACAYAEAKKCDEVWYGATGVDSLAGYWDADKYFIGKVNELISLNRENKIKIVAPLIDMNKADIVIKGVELGVDFAKTWTCYSNHEDGLADITTPSSSLRVKGFMDAGYRDPIQYKQQNFLNKKYNDLGCKHTVQTN